MKVLVAEDDDNIRNGLCEILEAEGYETLPARDGDEALRAFRQLGPDFACLDIMMPRLSGYDVCRQVRASGSATPIIFITAKSEEVDKVVGLELGADDYIVKPFGVREVIARIRAVTRRCMAARKPGTLPESFEMQDLRIVPAELRARRGETCIDLSLREVRLLELFHRNKGRVLDRYTLFSSIWGVDHIPNSRTLDQQIAKLRKRIETDPAEPRIVLTVHGVGYRYDG